MRDAEQLVADAYGVKRSFPLGRRLESGQYGGGHVLCCARRYSARPTQRAQIGHCGHHSFGAIPQWIVPTWDARFGVSHGLSLSSVQQAIAQFPHAKALVALNPTYFGVVPDIAAIAQTCQQHNITLIADEAHGPHFRFGGDDYPLPRKTLVPISSCSPRIRSCQGSVRLPYCMSAAIESTWRVCKQLCNRFRPPVPTLPSWPRLTWRAGR